MVLSLSNLSRADLSNHPGTSSLAPIRVRQQTDRPTSLVSFVCLHFVSGSMSSFERTGRGGGVVVCLVSRVWVLNDLTRPTDLVPSSSFCCGRPDSFRFGVGCCWCSHFRTCRPTCPGNHQAARSPLCVHVRQQTTDRPTSLAHVVRVRFFCFWIRCIPLLDWQGWGCSRLSRLYRLGPNMTDRPTPLPRSLVLVFSLVLWSGRFSPLWCGVFLVLSFSNLRNDLPNDHPGASSTLLSVSVNRLAELSFSRRLFCSRPRQKKKDKPRSGRSVGHLLRAKLRGRRDKRGGGHSHAHHPCQ